ncbi:MAG TPA: STAS domain-containing protein [Blastocatellia bacterium]|nr:STAS domain-containing protein [Blastocatellia bacterium]
MNRADYKPDLRVIERRPGGGIVIEGELTESNAEEFERQIKALTSEARREITIDLYGLDIDDGVALATAINSLRLLRARAARIVLEGAPQMLGHNLYRVGLLGDDRIELIDMRKDEPGGT